MNIFYLDSSPEQCAVWMVDKHVIKMILESCQLLSTAHRVLDGIQYEGSTKTGRKAKRWFLPDAREEHVYSATHINHPSAVWTRQSVENYNWLVEHTFALMNEFQYRYGKRHKCHEVMYYLQSPPYNLREYDMTLMPSAMADEYKISFDPIINYRNYYRLGKKHLHSWSHRQPPEWIY
jgi:hypothetical protein